MSFDILKREIKEGFTRGLYLFYGPEEYLKQYYAAEVERLVVDPIAKDISLSVFEEKPDLRSLNDACSAYPLYGSKRLIVIKNSGLLKQGAGSGRRKGGKTQPAKGLQDDNSQQPDKGLSLRGIINDLPDFTCLLILEQEVDKKLAIYNDITKKGLAVEFTYRSASELEDWVRAIAGRDGIAFARDALKQFIDNTGESMMDIRSELDKLLMYAAGKRGITAGDLAAVCVFPLKARIFDLLDNLIAGKKKQAVAELALLLRDREPAMRILSTLSNHLILLRQIKNLAVNGVKLPEATRLLGLNPYRVEKLWRQSFKIAPRAIEKAIEKCHQQDLAIKNGHINDIQALQMLLLTINI